MNATQMGPRPSVPSQCYLTLKPRMTPLSSRRSARPSNSKGPCPPDCFDTSGFTSRAMGGTSRPHPWASTWPWFTSGHRLVCVAFPLFSSSIMDVRKACMELAVGIKLLKNFNASSFIHLSQRRAHFIGIASLRICADAVPLSYDLALEDKFFDNNNFDVTRTSRISSRRVSLFFSVEVLQVCRSKRFEHVQIRLSPTRCGVL